MYRVARSTIKGSCRLLSSRSPAVGLSTQCSLARTTTPRYFSAARLVEILGREYDEEIEAESAILPDDLASLKEQIEADWQVVEDGAMTRLVRTLDNGAKAQVTFHCQDTVEYGSEETEDMSLMDDADDEAAVPVRISVAITKAGQTLALTCVTTDDLEARIESLAVSPQPPGEDGAVTTGNYQGPEFDELAEDLQNAFNDFLLDDVGMNQDVVSFISMFCDYKEQYEYVKFLDDTKSLIS